MTKMTGKGDEKAERREKNETEDEDRKRIIEEWKERTEGDETKKEREGILKTNTKLRNDGKGKEREERNRRYEEVKIHKKVEEN